MMIDIEFSTVNDPYNVKVNNKKENKRYNQLNQDYHYFYTCGDPDQFVNNIVTYPSVDDPNRVVTRSFQNLFDTFEYLFDVYKKGILIQIHNNELVNFLPFSKQNYVNDFHKSLRVDPKYGGNNHTTLHNFRTMIFKMNQGTKFESKNYGGIQKNMSEWISGNGLIRYEFPYSENDSGIPAIYHMFKTLCERRKIPDLTFFVNKRDHPVLRKDGNHAYNHLVGDNYPMKERYRDKMRSFLPILSMNSSDSHIDIPIPTWEDWGRIAQEEFNMVFLQNKNKKYTVYPNIENDFCLDFQSKKPTAIFRGSSTGLGTTVDNNMRLFVCQLSYDTNKINTTNMIPMLDCCLTGINGRPRTMKDDRYFRVIEQNTFKHLIGDFMNYRHQSEYKYVIHIEGHSVAYRLGIEMFFESVILYFPPVDGSNSKLWFFDRMVPNYHYILMEKAFDKDYILDMIQWCRKNEEKCRQIAANARQFALTNLRIDSCLNYLERTLSNLAIENTTVFKPECFSQKKIQQRDISSINSSYMKKLTPLHNIIESYWSDDNFVFHLYLQKLDSQGILEQFLDHHLVKENLLTKKNTTINLYEFRGKKFINKDVANESTSRFEHQAFVGYQAVNHMIDHYKSNFVYTYYHKHCKKTSRNFLLIEYKQAETLFNLIMSNKIGFYELISIYIQLVCILQYTQDSFAFCHNDMMPWNILVEEYETEQTFVFKESKLKLISKYNPILIDYDRSHIISNGKSYYSMVPFYPSKLTDVVFLVFKTLDCIFTNETYFIYNSKLMQQSPDDKHKKLVHLRNKQKFLDHVKNILSFFVNQEDEGELLGTYYIDEYNKSTVILVNKDIERLRSFLQIHSKYSTLLDIVKNHSVEYMHKTPMCFLQHIISNNIHNSTSVSASFRFLSSLIRSNQQNYLYVHSFSVCDKNFFQMISFMKNILSEQSNTIIANGHISHFDGFLRSLWKKYNKQKGDYLNSSNILYLDEFTHIENLFKERFDPNFLLIDNRSDFSTVDITSSALDEYIKYIQSTRLQSRRLIAPVYSIYSPEYNDQNTTRDVEYYKTIRLLYHHLYSNPKQLKILFNETQVSSFFDLLMF